MSFGVPIVASNASCIPEILGDSALYFNPKNADDMAEKISLLCRSQELKQTLRARGFEQINLYSWRKTARQTFKIYEEFVI